MRGHGDPGSATSAPIEESRDSDPPQDIGLHGRRSALARDGPAWESYVSDPGSVAEDDLLAHICLPDPG